MPMPMPMPMPMAMPRCRCRFHCWNVKNLLVAGVFYFIFKTSYRLNSIFKLCNTLADIYRRHDTDVELTLYDRVPESILCDFDRVLATLRFFCFILRLNLCATSLLNKVVSERQSDKVSVSVKVCSFDSFTGIICRKVCFELSSVFTSLC